MKQFLQKKAKLVFLCRLVLLTCTASANPRGRDGKTLADQIIASEETTIDASKINYKDISDKKLKKEIKKNIKDGQYTIQPTTFKNSMLENKYAIKKKYIHNMAKYKIKCIVIFCLAF